MSGIMKREEWATPKTFQDAMTYADMIARSTFCPDNMKGKPNEVMVAMTFGAEIGLSPLQALQNVAVINGKPSIYGDSALALVKGSGLLADIQEYYEGEGDNLTAVCKTVRTGQASEVVSSFSVKDAKLAGKWGAKGPWTNYPKRMLQMRARGFNLRDNFPDVLKGLITAEEAQDYPTNERSVTAEYNDSQKELDIIKERFKELTKKLDKDRVEHYRRSYKTYINDLDKLTGLLSDLENEIEKSDALVVEAEVVQEPTNTKEKLKEKAKEVAEKLGGSLVDSDDKMVLF